MLREEVVRGGVEPPTFRFSGIGTFQVTGTGSDQCASCVQHQRQAEVIGLAAACT
jgi:hypothetical protein